MDNSTTPSTDTSGNIRSGIKRERTSGSATHPTFFGDLPTPPTLAPSKWNFLKEHPFPNRNDEVISSPAPKMAKRDNSMRDPLSSSTVPRLIKEEVLSESDYDSEDTASASSPGSNSSSQGGTVTGNKGNNQQGPGATRYPGNVNYYQQNNPSVPRLFSINTAHQSEKIEPFCYNCKIYGHLKHQCNLRWYHWWPSEYLFRHPWLRRKLREARDLRLRGRMPEYKRMVKKIEEDVEVADKKKQGLFSQYRKNNQNWNGARYYRGEAATSRSRTDGQRILHAIRRNPKQEPTSPSCCPKQHEFSFDCKRLIEDLQRQVHLLRSSLTEIRLGSVSPAKLPTFRK